MVTLQLPAEQWKSIIPIPAKMLANYIIVIVKLTLHVNSNCVSNSPSVSPDDNIV